MVAWFIAMCILSDESACIAVSLAARSCESEVLVKFLNKALRTAEQVDHTLRVVRNEPHILPCISFDKAALFITKRIERFYPLTIIVLWTEETGLLVEEVAV